MSIFIIFIPAALLAGIFERPRSPFRRKKNYLIEVTKAA